MAEECYSEKECNLYELFSIFLQTLALSFHVAVVFAEGKETHFIQVKTIFRRLNFLVSLSFLFYSMGT